MSDLDYDPLEQIFETEIKLPSTGAPVRLMLSETITRNQLPFMRMIARMHDLFWDLPNVTTRDVDGRLQELYELLMDAAATAGISRMSVPQLRECCGKKRVWPGEPPKVDGALGWGLGDIVRRITRFFGFGHCAKCEERRKALNRIFRFGQK
jgi:hypothetical protein